MRFSRQLLSLAFCLITVSTAHADYLVSLRESYQGQGGGINQIARLNNQGTYIGNFLSAQAIADSGLNGPTGMAIGSDNLLYVASTFSSKIVRFDLQGNYVDTFATTNLDNPNGITWGPDGNLYVANSGVFDPPPTGTGLYSGNTVVRSAGTNSDSMTTYGSEHSGPLSVAFNSSGTLHVTEFNLGQVRAYTANDDGTVALQLITGPPGGIAFDGSDNMYVTDLFFADLLKNGASLGIASQWPGNLRYINGELFVLGASMGELYKFDGVDSLIPFGNLGSNFSFGFFNSLGDIVAIVPEPSSISLAISSFLGIAGFARRRAKSRQH